MTPKEKAIELYLSYEKALNIQNDMRVGANPFAKLLSIMTTDNLIDGYFQYKGMHDQEFFDSELKYWKEVKEEIQKL